MKQWLLCVFALTVVVSCSSQQQYVNRYDNFNADSIIQNERILLAYYKCVMEKGPCTKDGKNFKQKLPEALATNCAKCTDKQKQMGKVLVKQVKKAHPELWDELKNLYDPQGKYQKEFQQFLSD
ncbi:PREDICTED: ejaculatory bulb-specific protein 3-like isoform X3 [Papilio xuthus]|uniref:Ejaculatory bulb-specific protein 3-like isoform X3 n=1 Tax=Papilio xuthus TaxID=66420 RepID=A0AAJ6Z0U1_PAPXU|nr:PREDICTED: ejaculatory bulb-specific protein 3-like isoform X3 [Papilio xuthus]